MIKTNETYPPTPEQFGILVSRVHLLAQQLEVLTLAALRALPDAAPFDLLDPRDATVWCVCMEAEQLLRHCGYGPKPLPWMEPCEEEVPDAQ